MSAAEQSSATIASQSTTSARRRYPTDLTDWQWRKLRPLIETAPAPVGRPRETDLREVLSALCYRWRTRCVWRMLPHDFPPWPTVYAYERDWQQAGLTEEIRRQLGFRSEEPNYPIDISVRRSR